MVALFNKTALEPKDAHLIIGKICLTELWGKKITLHIQTNINIFIEGDCLRVKEVGRGGGGKLQENKYESIWSLVFLY